MEQINNTVTGMKVLTLSTNVRQLQQIASGKRKVETREIRPNTQDRYVIVDEEEAITGIIHYDAILFQSFGASVLVKIESAKLYEITDDEGELLFYYSSGKRHQNINIDYTLGEIIKRQGI